MQNLNENETIFDQLNLKNFANSAFAKGLSRLPRDQVILSLGLLADVAQGLFTDNQPQDQLDRNTNLEAIIKLVGQSPKKSVADIISKSEFEIDLMRQLNALTKSLRRIQAQRHTDKFEIAPEVRTELLAILQIAGQLNSVIPAFGKSPIGRFAKPLAHDEGVQAYAVIIWGFFREMGTILPPDEIASLAKSLRENSP